VLFYLPLSDVVFRNDFVPLSVLFKAVGNVAANYRVVPAFVFEGIVHGIKRQSGVDIFTAEIGMSPIKNFFQSCGSATL